ncbi:class-II fumarase/aspartase family protein [Pseudolabrys sp.]|uniref:class-II fumarase/aspartase family protein n=1 Tax=Pseudolabrys sp. TaxID=1960880 RepID=UPI003D0A9680
MSLPKTPPAVSQLFSEQSRIERYLEIEALLAEVQAELGILPDSVAREIRTVAKIANIDLDKLKTATDRIGYPIAPLVRQLTELCSKETAGFVHWGATTQDIMDTGLAIELKATFEIVQEELSRLIVTSVALADTHRATVMVGRTFGGHALPITFGGKVARWLAALCRHSSRIKQCLPRVCVGQLGGAVGTTASLGKHGEQTRRKLMQRLSLSAPVATWHSTRDSIAEAVCVLGLVMTTLGKVAADISALSSTEVGEVFEADLAGRDTSSTLPQKRNPVACSQIIAASKLSARYASMSLDSFQHDHERGPQGYIEDEIVPQCCVLTLSSLNCANQLLAGLKVDVTRMRANLRLTNGSILSEAVMMKLAPHVGRLGAHDILHEIAKHCSVNGNDFVAEIKAHSTIRKHLSIAAIDEITQPENYLGDTADEIDRAIAAAQATLNV